MTEKVLSALVAITRADRGASSNIACRVKRAAAKEARNGRTSST